MSVRLGWWTGESGKKHAFYLKIFAFPLSSGTICLSPIGKNSMKTFIKRLFLNKLERSIYDAAVEKGVSERLTFRAGYRTEFIVEVGDCKVEVNYDIIRVGKHNAVYTKSTLLYSMLHKIRSDAAKKNLVAKKLADYQTALDAVTKNKPE